MKLDAEFDVDKEFETLIATLRGWLSPEEIGLVERAFVFARQRHGDQKRASGAPYMLHPVKAALVLANYRLDAETYAACLLHDVLEDTKTTAKELEESFGAKVASLVEGVTKLRGLNYLSREETNLENVRKILLAMAADLRVVLIKLADRLHNMRTLQYLSEDKQQRIAQETMEIYVPLAHRLGIYELKWEMEDLAFRYLNPDEYRRLAGLVAAKRAEREAFVKETIDQIDHFLEEKDIRAQVSGRPKNLYSIYRKMVQQGKTFDEIYDLTAVRILVNTIPECYLVLGYVHEAFTVVPGRVKDYIALPKPNGYQSLHTTVMGSNGEPLEIQIRTKRMHEVDEMGVAAHWKYKEGKAADLVDSERFAWLRQMVDWQKDVPSSGEFVDRVKVDVFTDEVLVFTPKGDVINLPIGSTPVDFAYHIHTDIGNNLVGAKVNDRIVPIDTELVTGDRVQVITSRNSGGPKSDWLKFVKAASTKGHIRAYLRKKELEHSTPERPNVEERPRTVVTRPSLSDRRAVADSGFRIVVRGDATLPIVIATCCSPTYPDEILGYVTRGRGVTIHRVDCANIPSLAMEPERLVDAHWEMIPRKARERTIVIETLNVPGVLYQVSEEFAKRDINIKYMKNAERLSMFRKKGEAPRTQIKIVAEFADEATYRQTMEALRELTSVISVKQR
ncbi:RelA/SpoT family protein [Candidatus Cryosericum terrychapinii]|uniref:Bifunctional (P)ppGpp synthetase/guanosine-3',5'-bis(Diphosphate) 3'-pyrophosphohydrolase n=1 Tax=Candidatus Cryosericum terrychapinii TaxID=2290919 RepID=A0A398CTY9_9BACT|nr:bifunctional (p)ppGpp synthetase/guanosine-3',5'-bis(diphosphate) 3'-pyrophosphohydrolase [Candidatus Cryosericum terrychapinii]RIE06082.1 bifunctional (p)ppGpp synthetase/guanosine-3',5'-bis(diphosphate) 3'-pyrophosphohydrolase [Candidatus Cryosericum terrychapinii]